VTPVYPYLVAGIFAVFGIQTKAAAFAVLGMNTLFSALTCIPIFYIAKRTVGLPPAKLAVWLWVFFPYSIFFSAASMWYHSLLALLLTTLFMISLSLEDATDIWPWAGFGLLCGLVVLTSPVALAALPVLLAWPCYRRWRASRSFRVPLTATALGLALVITPWLLRNLTTFHQPVFLKDNFWMEVAIGNVGNSVHWWNGLVIPPGSAEEMKAFERLGELPYLAMKRAEVLSFIRSRPLTFVSRSLRRVLYFWTGFWSFGREYLRQEPMDPWSILLCSTYSLLLFLGLARLLRHSPQVAAPFALLLFLYPIVYYLTHPEFSYRLPLDPVGIILASYFLVSLRPKKLAAGGESQAGISSPGTTVEEAAIRV
jgi:4-amino-4-deoxy-L-arabinose transferase-like glycosyltransferase